MTFTEKEKREIKSLMGPEFATVAIACDELLQVAIAKGEELDPQMIREYVFVQMEFQRTLAFANLGSDQKLESKSGSG